MVLPYQHGFTNGWRVLKTWDNVFSRYFDGATHDQIKYMPEAIAPLPAFKTGSSSAITIDIGGGTSDFLFADGKDVVCISSARFASNSLFGSNSAFDSADNGFIKYFKPQYEAVQATGAYYAVLDEISRGANASANLASFFSPLPKAPSSAMKAYAGRMTLRRSFPNRKNATWLY